MLTVDFDRLPVGSGSQVIDVGCGAGRHAFEAYRRGADVIAFDQDEAELSTVEEMFAGMAESGEAACGASASTMGGDALDLPFPDASFDCVIASEILEHVPEDEKVIWELSRVVKPGGMVAVTVPRRGPELVCWALSDAYHQVEGGHVRIYREQELIGKLRDARLSITHQHYAHALHSPYWWLKCAVGVHRENHPLVAAYHRLLVWDLLRRPWATRLPERLLNPVVGKSVAMYLTRES